MSRCGYIRPDQRLFWKKPPDQAQNQHLGAHLLSMMRVVKAKRLLLMLHYMLENIKHMYHGPQFTNTNCIEGMHSNCTLCLRDTVTLQQIACNLHMHHVTGAHNTVAKQAMHVALMQRPSWRTCRGLQHGWINYSHCVVLRQGLHGLQQVRRHKTASANLIGNSRSCNKGSFADVAVHLWCCCLICECGQHFCRKQQIQL